MILKNIYIKNYLKVKNKITEYMRHVAEVIELKWSSEKQSNKLRKIFKCNYCQRSFNILH